MRCLSCNCELSDREANRKFLEHEEIKNPEDQYVGLCDRCLSDSDLSYYNEEPYEIESESNNDLPNIDWIGDCI